MCDEAGLPVDFVSRDLGYSTQKKKADFESAGPADNEYLYFYF